MYLELIGWRGGTLELSFHTLEPDVLLLYQPDPEEEQKEGQAQWNKAQLYVFVRQGMHGRIKVKLL